MAEENSVNEGQGYKALIKVATAKSWDEAYKVMESEGKILQERGWSQGPLSRSENYCNDVWLEPDHGQGWKDWHSIQIIASTFPVRLINVKKGDQK